MESYAARLASFNETHPARKRASNASTGKTLKWPHKNPSPPQLARAGFFYKPTSSCPDNTTCYLCNSSLDGWEPNDIAVEEHLKHAPNCGWAITIATELEIEDRSQSQEDPMSERMLNARRMTFGSKWPHESKRGWACKTQKMIEAGWYYCPTLESEDFVKCSYCTLSLDGWEPKDDPHDEHQRRSPDCVFFARSTPAKPKAGRSRRGRASKASRTSTQSNFTTMSEGVSVADSDTHGDEIILPVVEPAKTAKSGRGAKKGSKAKKPTGKSKKQAGKVVDEIAPVPSSFLEPEDDDFEVKVEKVTTESKGGKKRKSDVMSTANDGSIDTGAYNREEETQDQPSKRRATRTRGSVAQTNNAPSPPPHEEHSHDVLRTEVEETPPPALPLGQKKRKGSSKRGTSNVRKASTTSTASKASLRATMPPDEEIDAALEAELDRPLTDEEGDIEPLPLTKSKGRRLTRTRPGSKKATASVAPTRRTTRASTVTIDDVTMQDMYPSLPEPAEEDHLPTFERNENATIMRDTLEGSSPPAHQEKGTASERSEQQNGYDKETETLEGATSAVDDKMDEETPSIGPQQPRSRQEPRRLPARKLDVPKSFEPMDQASDINSSMLGAQTAADGLEHETDASVVKQARTKRGSRKVSAKKVKGNQKAAVMNQNIEDIVRPTVDDREQGPTSASVDDPTGVVTVSVEVKDSKKQLNQSTRTAKPEKTMETLPEPQAFVREGSVPLLVNQLSTLAKAEIASPSTQPPSARSTPKPATSPQSSDAENQPPSSCLSKPGPPSYMQSPSRSQTSRVPLAVTTPISSPSRNNISNLQSTFPWTAVELENVFDGTPNADKENSHSSLVEVGTKMDSVLTSPEKKLTVEQWIHSNAQRGEEKLRNECERLVGKFEDQGVRALRVLECIVCADRP